MFGQHTQRATFHAAVLIGVFAWGQDKQPTTPFPQGETRKAMRLATQGNLALLQDRNGSRARATLALGAFDRPEVKPALLTATGNPQLAPYAHAALFRLSKSTDKSQLHKMAAAVQMLEGSKAKDEGAKVNTLVIGEPIRLSSTQQKLMDYLTKKADSELTRKFLREWKAPSKKKEE